MKKICVILLSMMLVLTGCLSSFATDVDVAGENDLENGNVINENAVAVDAAAETDASGLMIFAKAVVLMEKSTGKILYCENENEKLYPASVTKIMTLLLVCEAIDSGKIKMTDKLTCSENAASKGGSQIWLEVGETMSVEELIKAAAVYSANDACTLLGEYVSGSESAFVAAMNERANQLGMKNTHFDNCTGLDDTTETHLSTANDIAVMSRELLKHEYIKNYTTIYMDSLRNGETQLVNTNKLVRFYDGMTGLKTGTTTKAGCCISASAKRNGMELIAVVLGSENSNDRFTTARNLLDWGFANYELVSPKFDTSLIKPVRIAHGEEQYANAVIPEVSPVLVNKGKSGNIKSVVEMQDSIEAPVKAGSEIGKISVYLGEKLLSEYKITAEKDISVLTFPKALYKLLSSF